MTSLWVTSATLRDDTRGATIVEFAIIVPVLIALLLSILEVGYRGYVTAVVQGALSSVAAGDGGQPDGGQRRRHDQIPGSAGRPRQIRDGRDASLL
ncbi:TadE family protein [Sphingomonas faeni]|uniref:TadE family protein n=1 Tax=Sphingomonas faeni TaxID=185950 RepID=UPI0035941396